MKKNIALAIVSVIVSGNVVLGAEWRIGETTYANKSEATRAAKAMALERAEQLFANPTEGFLALEKGKSQYLAVSPEHEQASKFRCEKRNGEKLVFEDKQICVLTIKQYASRVVFPGIAMERLGKGEGGFRRASGK